MKFRYFFILLFAIIIQSTVSTNSVAMENDERRRIVTYPSPQAYLASFNTGERNHGKLKILFVGAGLTYDDMVEQSRNQFATQFQVSKTRKKFYPTNAFLIDLNGLFFYNESLSSHSDFQASIDINLGEKGGLPKIFMGEFDCIVLENLDFSALTGKAFENLYSLLKIGGKIISNVHFEVEIKNLETISQLRKERQEFGALDEHHNALVELFYPEEWVDNDESLFEQYTFIISPVDSVKDQAFTSLAEHHESLKISLIPFHTFAMLYNENQTYRTFILKEARDIFRQNVTKYFTRILPHAVLSFADAEEVWCASHPILGFFVISKKQ